jgi:hypothetical protein
MRLSPHSALPLSVGLSFLPMAWDAKCPEIFQAICIDWSFEPPNWPSVVDLGSAGSYYGCAQLANISISLENQRTEVCHPEPKFMSSPVSVLRKTLPLYAYLLCCIGVRLEEAFLVSQRRKLTCGLEAIFCRSDGIIALIPCKDGRCCDLKFPTQPMYHPPKGLIFHFVEGRAVAPHLTVVSDERH